MINRSPGPPNTTSVVTTKLGGRTERICVLATWAPRASAGPCRSDSATVNAGADLRQSLGQFPLGTSGLSSLA
jgi:hypothetical protein